MSQFQIDPDTGEIVRSGGKMARVSGVQEVAQHLRVRLRLFAGEVPTNLALGMRYVGVILGKGVPPERIEGEFFDMAIGTPGIVSVDRIDLDTEASDRSAVVEFSGTISLPDLRTRIPFHDRFSVGQP